MATKKEARAAVEGRFLWLAASCYWSGAGTTLHLEHGEVYSSRLAEADVLAEWIRTGAAQMVEDKEK